MGTSRSKNEKKLNRFECAICHKLLPSVKVAEAHLQKANSGEGYITCYLPIQRDKEQP